MPKRFDKPEDDERFLLDVVSSDVWKWISGHLEERRDSLIGLMGAADLTGDTRNYYTARFVEVEHLLRTPVNMLKAFKIDQDLMDKGEETQNLRARSLKHPDILGS